MAEIRWLNGEANVGTERICPGRHIRHTEWQSSWNGEFIGKRYDYISDYECIFPHPIILNDLHESDKEKWDDLQAAKEQGFGIKIRNMAHFTQPAAADEIMDSGGFIGGMKKINEDENGHRVRECFSWWSPIFENDTIDMMKQHLQEALGPFFQDDDNIQNIAAQFASSNAFLLNPNRYGNAYFECTIDELCDFYEAFIQDGLQYRVLGTFLYMQEIMHAVLVCGKENGRDLFANYPEIPNQANDSDDGISTRTDGDGDSSGTGGDSSGDSSGGGNGGDGNGIGRHLGNVVTRDDSGIWKWYPQATAGIEIKRVRRYRKNVPEYRRWEHVAFAFHIRKVTMPVHDLASRRKFLPHA